jgi:hypothetical protein
LAARLTAAEADADRLAEAAEWHGTCSTCQEALRLHDEALARRERPQ